MTISEQVGTELAAIRKEKQLSQGDMEKRTGLLRCYVSRVEHGYTVPSVDTLDRLCKGLQISVSELFRRIEGGV